MNENRGEAVWKSKKRGAAPQAQTIGALMNQDGKSKQGGGLNTTAGVVNLRTQKKHEDHSCTKLGCLMGQK
jgi:hypothetical protein